MTVETDARDAGGVTGRARNWLRARVDRDESGLALVWMAMFLMVILGFAALAIDIGHGYAVAQRAQNAADSAALAGTIYLPTDVTTAYSTAQTTAASDGFKNGVNNVTVTPEQQATVSQLKVTVKQTVPTWFARVIGIKTMNISRSGTADYRPPVEMGSPSPQYGNNPEVTKSATTYPNFWAHVAGPNSPKGNGDAYQGGICDSSDDCSAPPPDTSCGYSGNNTDYSCDGYDYTVHVPTATTALKLQAFDPGFVAVGDSCGYGGDDGADLTDAATLTSAQVKGWPSGVTFNASTRYREVDDATKTTDAGLTYCTGDHSYASDPNITTTYSVFGPAAIPGDPSSAPSTPLCSKAYSPYIGDLSTQLKSSTKMPVYANGSSSPEYLAQYFRQWDNLCPGAGTLNVAAGDYFIQVQTNLTLTGAPNTSGDGGNRFALRATGGTNVGIYGNGKMGIYANVGGGVLTQFYLARLLPGDAGHTLTVSLFDIGDGSQSTSPGTLTIVPPPDGKNGTGALSLSGCTMQLGDGNGYTATNGSGCQVTGVTSDGYANKWLTIEVPIPAGYTCTVATLANCWFRINYQFSGYIDDTTSWTASLGGDPVRIVK